MNWFIQTSLHFCVPESGLCRITNFQMVYIEVSQIQSPLTSVCFVQDLHGDMELGFTTTHVNNFFRILHHNGTWISGNDRDELVIAGQYFVEGFCKLAGSTTAKGLFMFKIRPKLHMYMELLETLKLGEAYAFNILTSSCWTDEDFIGVCSATSRSCHSGIAGYQLSIRTVQKVLGRYKQQFLAKQGC